MYILIPTGDKLSGPDPLSYSGWDMERPSYVAALSVPFLRQAMIEVTEDKVDAGHMADVRIERYPPKQS